MLPVPLHHVWEYTDVDRAFWQRHLEDWVPGRIFDAHTHVNEPRFRLVEPHGGDAAAVLGQRSSANRSARPSAQRCYETVFPAASSPAWPSAIRASITTSRRATPACGSSARRGWSHLIVSRPDWPAERLEAELKASGALGVKPYYSLIPGQDPSTRQVPGGEHLPVPAP